MQRSTKYMSTKTTSAGMRPVPAAAPAGKLKMPMPTMPEVISFEKSKAI